MTFDEVSFASSTWVVPGSRMKMQREHHVPLSDAALRLLADQMAGRGRSGFIFPGMRPRPPLSAMAMTMLMRRLGAGEFTVHGMRSAARSWMGDQGVAFEVAEACLADAVGNQVVAAYMRSDMLERRRPTMQAWSDFVTGKNDAKVIPIKGRVRAPLRRSPA
jgi:integrase